MYVTEVLLIVMMGVMRPLMAVESIARITLVVGLPAQMGSVFSLGTYAINRPTFHVTIEVMRPAGVVTRQYKDPGNALMANA